MACRNKMLLYWILIGLATASEHINTSTGGVSIPPVVITMSTDSSFREGDPGLEGSVMGGTLLHIRGFGFVSSKPSDNQVTIDGRECVVQEYNACAGYVSCLTPALPSGASSTNLSIQVYSSGVLATCLTTCQWSYNQEKTVVMRSIFPCQQVPEAEIRFYGEYKGANSTDIADVSIGSAKYIMLDDDGDDLNIGTLDGLTYIRGYGGEMQAKCSSDSISFRIGGPWGEPEWHGMTDNYKLDGSTYKFLPLALITGMMTSSCSVNGGARLFIQGKGFPDMDLIGNVSVSINGNVCNVSYTSYAYVYWITTELTVNTYLGPYYPGGAGFRHLKWENESGSDVEGIDVLDENLATESYITTLETLENVGDNYKQKMLGLFKAPRSGDYRFFITSEDHSRVYMSSGSSSESMDPANKQMILDYTKTSEFVNSQLIHAEGRTVYITLAADQYYYMEIHHAESTGNDHFTMGIEIPHDYSDCPNKLYDVQQYTVTPIVDREIQMISIFTGTVTGGKFRFRWGPNLTPEDEGADWSDDVDVVCSRIVSMAEGMGTGSLGCVADAATSKWTITFNSPRPVRPRYPLMLLYQAYGNFPGLQGDNIRFRTEIQRDPAPSPPLQGDFRLSYQGCITPNLINDPFPYNITASDLQEQLNANCDDLFNNKLIVEGSGDMDGISFFFILGGHDGSVEMIQPFDEDFSGGRQDEEIATQVTRVLTGNDNCFWRAIPSEFLYTLHSTPQLQIEICNQPAVCQNGACDFQYEPPAQKEITNIRYSGNNWEISGRNFGYDTALVTIGCQPCSDVFVDDSLITCTWRETIVGSHQAVVDQDNFGIIEYADDSTGSLDHTLSISSVDPVLGGCDGGGILTLIGIGFPPQTPCTGDSATVMVGNSPCEISYHDGDILICTLGTYTTDSLITLTVYSNGGTYTTTNNDFTYECSSTPTIDDVVPAIASPYVSTQITITGSGLMRDLAEPEVWIRNSNFEIDCLVTSYTTSEVICNLNGGLQGTYDVELIVGDFGSTSWSGFQISFDISSVTPNIGSPNGGTLLTIRGSGFSEIASQSLIFITDEDHQCVIDTIYSSDHLTCRTPEATNLAEGVAHDVLGIGRIQEESTCSGGNCTFTYDSTYTPVMNSVSKTSGGAGERVSVYGSGFGIQEQVTQVLVDGTAGLITLQSDAQIEFEVPDLTCGPKTFEVIIDDQGTATNNLTSNFQFEVKLGVTSTTPNSGSQGGARITVNGAGFGDNPTVNFGGVACVVTSVAHTQITCELGAGTGTKNVQVTGCDGQVWNCSDSSTCGYNFDSNDTPVITDISMTDGEVTIVGSGFENGQNTVTIGGNTCEIYYETSTAILCFSAAPAGQQTVLVHVVGKGYASGQFNINTALTITGPTISEGSFAGCHEVTFDGTGLGMDDDVTICDIDCAITAANGSTLTCSTGALLSEYSLNVGLDKHFSSGNGINGTADPTWFSSEAEDDYGIDNSYDNNPNTHFKAASADNCHIGVDAGEGYKLDLHRFTFLPNRLVADDIDNAAFSKLEYSDDGSSWVLAHRFGMINNTYNNWQPAGTMKHRYWRFANGDGISSNCIAAELAFTGDKIHDSSGDLICDVVVKSQAGTADEQTATLSNGYKYKGSKTPTITGMSPEHGANAGGTEVTITGSSFGSNANDVTVTIDGIQASIISVSSSSIRVTTDPRPSYVASHLEVLIDGYGCANTKGFQFLYADLWSDTATWGGEVPPREGEFVQIPAGQNVLVDISPPKLEVINVEGELRFKDGEDLKFQANSIFINGGRFVAGTENSCFSSQLEIELFGTPSDSEIPIYGNKMIGVREGLLELNGCPLTRTWTVLNGSINAGERTLTVVDDISDWSVGDIIVIASTSFEHEESEQHTIASISANTITTVDNFAYSHYGATESYDNGNHTIQLRGEVGNLSRKIKVFGSDSDPVPYHGAHIYARSDQEERTIIKLAYVEMYNVGQAHQLGRYPINISIGSVLQSYITGCAIRGSNNRAITLNSTHFMPVSWNVAYSIKGHAFFLETGIEHGNLFEYNLGVSTLRAWSLQNTDYTPATFWIPNPDNRFIGNHSAGSDSHGFWYDIGDDSPGSNVNNSDICAKGISLGDFNDNHTHSNGRYGLLILSGLIPRTYPCEDAEEGGDANPSITAHFNGFTSWKNKRVGAWIEEAGDVHFNDFKMADNLQAGIEVTYMQWSQQYVSTRISNAFILGKSSNNSGDTYADFIGVITPQSDGMVLDGVTYYNFDADMYTLGDESRSDLSGFADWGGRMHKLRNITFGELTVQNTEIKWKYPYRGYYELEDNTLTGSVGWIASPDLHHLLGEHCAVDAAFNSVVCTNSVQLVTVGLHSATPAIDFNGQQMEVYRESGTHIPIEPATVDTPRKTVTDHVEGGKYHNGTQWALPYVTEETYIWNWELNTDFTSVEVASTAAADEWLILEQHYTDFRANYTVQRVTAIPDHYDQTQEDFVDPRNVTHVERPLESTDPFGTTIWDLDDQIFEIMVNGIPGNDAHDGDAHVDAHRCLPDTDDEEDDCRPEIDEYGYSIPDFGSGTGGSEGGGNGIGGYGGGGGSGSSSGDPRDAVKEDGPCRYWSEVTQWILLGFDGVPEDGQNVTIPYEWCMILDVDTNILDMLTIDGDLLFKESVDIKLQAHWILVRFGTLTTGNATVPIASSINHQIILYGEEDDFGYSFDYAWRVEAGNKALAVTGYLGLFGATKTAWTYLCQNAFPNETVIYVENAFNWNVTDEIVLASSSYDQNDTDTCIISGIEFIELSLVDEVLVGTSAWNDKNGLASRGKDPNDDTRWNEVDVPSLLYATAITCEQPLQHYHAGHNPKISSMYTEHTVEMRAEVMNLSRNVKIIGDKNGHAANVVVANTADGYDALGEPIYVEGRADLSYVGVENCGQKEVHRAGLRFERNNLMSYVVYSVVRDSMTYSVYVHKSEGGVTLQNNIFINSVRHGILITESSNAILTSNIVLGTQPRNATEPAQEKSSNYFICPDGGCDHISLQNNIAAGGFIGFLAAGQNCTETDGVELGTFSSLSDMLFIGNTAHSVNAGWYIANPDNHACLSVGEFTAYRNSEVGVVSQVALDALFLTNFKLLDNIQGTSFTIAHSSYTTFPRVTITSSLYMGTSFHVNCTDCASMECTQRFGAVLGTFRIGSGEVIGLDNYIPYPFDFPEHASAWQGEFLFNGVTFSNYNNDEVCSIPHFGVTTNPNVSDRIHEAKFIETTRINVGEENIVYINNPREDWAVEGYCGEFVCTGQSNVLIIDEDGTLVESSGPSAVLSGNQGLASSQLCFAKPVSNAYFCYYTVGEEQRYASLVWESNDSDSYIRTISPIYVTGLEDENNGYTMHDGGDDNQSPGYDYMEGEEYDNSQSTVGNMHPPEHSLTTGGQFYNKINSFRNYPHTYAVQQNLRMSRFVSVVQLDRSYEVKYTGTLPKEMTYQLQATENETDGAIVQVNYVRPYGVTVWKNGEQVGARIGRPDIATDVTMDDPSGTHRWVYESNSVVFKISGSDMITLKVGNSIQLTMRISMTTEEFFADNGATEFIDRLAAVLNIPSYRIRIVDSYRGSTVLVIFIDQDAELAEETGAGSSSANGTGSSAVQEELSAVQALLLEATQGDDFPYSVLGLDTALIEGIEVEEVVGDGTSTGNGSGYGTFPGEPIVIVQEDQDGAGEDEEDDDDETVYGHGRDDVTINMQADAVYVLISIGVVFVATIGAVVAYIIIRKRRKQTKIVIAEDITPMAPPTFQSRKQWKTEFDGRTPDHRWGLPKNDHEKLFEKPNFTSMSQVELDPGSKTLTTERELRKTDSKDLILYE